MENKQEIVIEEKKSWNEINKQFCEESSLNDMSGWYELD